MTDADFANGWMIGGTRRFFPCRKEQDMSNSIGTVYRFTIWGQSHAPAIGVTIEGIPAGTQIDLDRLQEFLDRRRPGQGAHTTSRKECDRPEFVAGVTGNVSDAEAEAGHTITACGAPVTALIRNADTRSSDYSELEYIPRPGHADYTAMVRYGEARDFAGGGQFSGRMTAPLCIAGGIALQILEGQGITVHAYPVRIGGESEPEKMMQAIEEARSEGDSVGGIIECRMDGVPAGIGEPMFDGIENRISQIVFGIPAVKGIEFGSGFAGADEKGSRNNDPFVFSPETDKERSGSERTGRPDGDDTAEILSHIRTLTNNHGGALGGMSSGMPILFRAAFKPTPSIAIEQDSVDIRTGEDVRLSIRGRHDPCIVLRAVPVVEAAAAAALYDLIRLRNGGRIR